MAIAVHCLPKSFLQMILYGAKLPLLHTGSVAVAMGGQILEFVSKIHFLEIVATCLS